MRFGLLFAAGADVGEIRAEAGSIVELPTQTSIRGGLLSGAGEIRLTGSPTDPIRSEETAHQFFLVVATRSGSTSMIETPRWPAASSTATL